MQTRSQLVQRLQRQKAEIAQLLQDINSWNDNNQFGHFIDPEEGRLAQREIELDRMLWELKAE